MKATKLSEFCAENESWKGGHTEKLAPKESRAWNEKVIWAIVTINKYESIFISRLFPLLPNSFIFDTLYVGTIIESMWLTLSAFVPM